MSKRWYVVQVKTNHEEIVRQELKQQRFNVFNPVYKGKGRIGKKEFDRLLPLFPNYIFVQFDIRRNHRWPSIRHTRGVVAMIGCTDKYVTPVPAGCVEALIQRSEDEKIANVETAVAEIIAFSEGMELEIRDKNFEGIVGTYCNHSEKRVQLLVTLLNRRIKVSLPLDKVRVAKPTNSGSVL